MISYNSTLCTQGPTITVRYVQHGADVSLSKKEQPLKKRARYITRSPRVNRGKQSKNRRENPIYRRRIRDAIGYSRDFGESWTWGIGHPAQREKTGVAPKKRGNRRVKSGKYQKKGGKTGGIKETEKRREKNKRRDGITTFQRQVVHSLPP